MSPQPAASHAARLDLLERVVDEIASGGLGDRSLRDIAAAAGTSHRMLLYHFGSRPGLVAAVVDEIERRQRALMALDAAADLGPRELALASWRRVSDASVLPFVRLFFEVAGQHASLPARAGADMTQGWVDDVVRIAADAGAVADEAEVRLGIAVVRGLLVDIVTGGDPAAATAAFHRYLDLTAPER